MTQQPNYPMVLHDVCDGCEKVWDEDSDWQKKTDYDH